MVSVYVTVIPRRFILDSERPLPLKLGRSRRSQLLHPFLRVSGIGLRLVLDKVWELHVRL